MNRASTRGENWPLLALACAANFVTSLDLWVVNIAYPEFERSFAPATLSDLSWILNAYAIVLASGLIPAGRMADSVGGKRSFLAGLALFGLASLGCGLAPTLPALIACRALQGVAAAVLMPTSLGFALSAFPEQGRATAVGVWAATSAVAATSGPLVGGLLLTLSWRWLFFINVPLLFAAFVAGMVYLPASVARARRRIDWRGALLVFGSMGLVCTALVEANTWSTASVGSTLAVGALLAAAIVFHVRRHADPIVMPGLFLLARFRAGVTGIFVYYVGFASMLVGCTLLLTDGWHFSVLHAAMAIAPGPITASVLSPFAGRFAARHTFRTRVVTGASFFAAAGAWLMLAARPAPSYAVAALPALLCWGVANALLQPTLFATADAAARADVSSASAVLTMARQLGSAFGVALLVGLLESQPASGSVGLRNAWSIVIATGVLTALTGLLSRSVYDQAGPRAQSAPRATGAA